MVEALLEADAEVDMEHEHGMPLRIAAENGQTAELVALLAGGVGGGRSR